MDSDRQKMVFKTARRRVSSGGVPANQPAKTSMPAEQPYFPLPRYEAPARPKSVVRKRTSHWIVALRVGGVAVLVLMLTSGFLTWKGYVKFHKVFHGTTTVAALSDKTVSPSLLNGEGDGRVNILLLGIGGPGHDGPDLTDTIVILSVDPVNDTASMVSIPRDLWVKMPVSYIASYQKINAAYESGKYQYLNRIDATESNAAAINAGFSSIDQAITMVTGVNINYHILVNFQAFRQAVDTVGGVTINVPTALVDPTMAWENNWNPVLAPAGVQQMDGKQALLYARSRETSSDFARAERQRQILVALKDKVLTAGTLSNPTKINGLLNAFGDNVYSDLSTQGAMRLVNIMQKVGDNKISSIGLTDPGHDLITTDHVGTTSVDRPVAGFNDYTGIQSYILSQIPDGYIVKEHAAVAVLSKTAAGATADTALLKEYGYSVTGTGTSDAALLTPVLVDLSHGKDPYTLHYLENRFDVKPVTQLPVGVSATDGAKFVIIDTK